ncbi:hypothetical protein ACFQDN_24835 [Pseudomonas asuensis]
MTSLDLIVVAVYLVFIIVAAACFRRYAQSSSQFINGGGSMPWWMAGSTAFMTQFSAWTFTGAAGKAFTDGFPVLVLFWGNALGFFIACVFFAARYRKLRVETSMQVIALRFGKPTEQLFTWLQFPLSTLTAAIWLNGLAYILSSMTGFGMVPTLLVTGTVITFISASGGGVDGQCDQCHSTCPDPGHYPGHRLLCAIRRWWTRQYYRAVSSRFLAGA